MQRITKRTIETTVTKLVDSVETVVRTTTEVHYAPKPVDDAAPRSKEIASSGPQDGSVEETPETTPEEADQEHQQQQQQEADKSAEELKPTGIMVGPPEDCEPIDAYVTFATELAQQKNCELLFLYQTSREYLDATLEMKFPNALKLKVYDVDDFTDADLDRLLENMPKLQILRTRNVPLLQDLNPRVKELRENAIKEGPEVSSTIVVPPPDACAPLDEFTVEMNRISNVQGSVKLTINRASREYLDVVLGIKFPHMRTLCIYDLAEFTDTDLVTLLSNFTDLEELKLEGNPLVTDIKPLTAFSSTLKDLAISDSDNLTDFEPLKELSHLVRLNLIRTKITDLSLLAGLKELRQLRLYLSTAIDLDGGDEDATGFRNAIQAGNPAYDPNDPMPTLHFLTILGRLPQICKLTDINGNSFACFRSLENPRDFVTIHCGGDFGMYADTLTASPEQFRDVEVVGQAAIEAVPEGDEGVEVVNPVVDLVVEEPVIEVSSDAVVAGAADAAEAADGPSNVADAAEPSRVINASTTIDANEYYDRAIVIDESDVFLGVSEVEEEEEPVIELPADVTVFAVSRLAAVATTSETVPVSITAVPDYGTAVGVVETAPVFITAVPDYDTAVGAVAPLAEIPAPDYETVVGAVEPVAVVSLIVEPAAEVPLIVEPTAGVPIVEPAAEVPVIVELAAEEVNLFDVPTAEAELSEDEPLIELTAGVDANLKNLE
ncbi:hypothetical protein BDR26DRAFT_858384 [Obelidium mucronatum]|nr:hypothetical protein BDR26DRAFT_858384 [Obelidium mucronatum]